VFTYKHRVRYHEADQQGFLFNSRYLEIADTAMAEYFRDLGWRYAELNELGVDPSVVRVEATFSSPARFEDDLDAAVQCVQVGRSSFQLRTTISCGTRQIAVLDLTYVNVDAVSAVSSPLPAKVAEALRWDAPSRSSSDTESNRLRALENQP
jgi:acyl-CoA thioester hydrolase